MTHIRQQIREQATIELDAALPEFKEVSKSRLYAYREDKLPSLNVITPSEESAPMHLGGPLGAAPDIQKRLTDRTVTLVTEIYCTADVESVDDEMDQLCVGVERVLGSTLLNNLASDISLVSTTLGMDSEADIPVGIILMNWAVVYRTYEGDPETSI